MAEAFRALADPSRRSLLDSLERHNGQTLRELCVGLDMARQSVSKHLAVLEAANLVTTLRRGREKLHFLNAAPINAIADRWINRYDRQRAEALADLTTALEQTMTATNTATNTANNPPAGGDPDFVYTTYIKTRPEQLWQAITDPTFTRRYWGVALTSTWEVGDLVTWEFAGATMADPAQIVLESAPPHRLSYRWHAITPEFAAAINVSGDELTALQAEGLSNVTFDIEQIGEMVKLTVIHGGFAPGSVIRTGISDGWPTILASLKTLLETGEPLPFD
ncbi:MAG: metalloregulator ArsR/SmtB family transcription factor [Ilumatobacteraceae bacterium]